MTEKLTTEDCKLLTEWLGECWHEYDVDGHSALFVDKTKKCIICGKKVSRYKTNRTFCTDKDMMDVFRKLVDRSEYKKFKKSYIVRDEWIGAHEKWDSLEDWLFYSPERFCKLVAMAIREGVIKCSH